MTKPYLKQARGILKQLSAAYERLKEALVLPSTQIHKDATIKRFEFTFELAWKLMQAIVRYQGTDIFGPRESIRAAARYDLITDPETWMKLLDARNITVHVYQELMAYDVYEQAKKLPVLVEVLLLRVKDRLEKED